MIPKKCCLTCLEYGLDFKLDGFCFKYEDDELENCCQRYYDGEYIKAQGEWIDVGKCVDDGRYMKTSCCNRRYLIKSFAVHKDGKWLSERFYLPKICPNCGAVMILDVNNT